MSLSHDTKITEILTPEANNVYLFSLIPVRNILKDHFRFYLGRKIVYKTM